MSYQSAATVAAAPPPDLAKLRPLEALPWAAALAFYVLAPGYEPLATQVFVMILFALSLNLLVGFSGIVTLGHAALFGTGAYTAGLLAVNGVNDPLVTALSRNRRGRGDRPGHRGAGAAHQGPRFAHADDGGQLPAV